jgi:two-component sensor histidine kinase
MLKLANPRNRCDRPPHRSLRRYSARPCQTTGGIGSGGLADPRLKVDDVELHLDCAVATGLIVNERVSTAVKHAFFR